MNKKSNKGKKIPQSQSVISWNHDQIELLDILQRPLLKKFPEMGRTLSKSVSFVVKEHEHAILLKNGEFVSEMPSGTYELDKESRKIGTEIIYFETAIQNIPWGIPQNNGIRTKDGFLIGMYGEIKVRIHNAISFYKYVIGGLETWTIGELKQWIKSLLHTSLREIYAKYELKNIFQEDSETVMNKMTAKMIEESNLYGLIIESFCVLGYKASEEANQYIDSNQTTSLQKYQFSEKIQQKKYQDQEIIQNRIASLEKRRNDLQDQCLDTSISKDDYEMRICLLSRFLKESKNELELLMKKQDNH